MPTINLNLHLFDEGAVAESTGTDTTATTSTESTDTTSAVETSNPQPERVPYEELIKGEYKEDYDRNIQSIVKKRVKNIKKENEELTNRFNSANRIVELMADKYGKRDIDSLYEAIMSDTSGLEQEAYDNGFTDVNAYAKTKRLERENRLLKEQESERAKAEYFRKQYDTWDKQANEMKDKYPSFNWEEERENSEFFKLLQSGVSVENAYRSTHLDEILKNATAQAITDAQKATTANIAQRGTRAVENASSSSTGAQFKTDVSKLTAKQRADIARRVAEGEVISFQ